MKKIFCSLFMVAALVASTSVMANDDTKKESDCKAKTENCDKKKDATCCDKKKDGASCDKKKENACCDKKKENACTEKKDKENCPAQSQTTEESKSCGKK